MVSNVIRQAPCATEEPPTGILDRAKASGYQMQVSQI